MRTYPIYSKMVINLTVFHLSGVFFYWRFLVSFISTEKWNQKCEIPWWSSNIYFFSRVQISFDIKDFDVAVFMVRVISIGNDFWVLKTWRPPVRKRLKRSTLNFAHTFLTGWLATCQSKKNVEKCNSVGAWAHKVGKVFIFWPNFEPIFSNISRVLKR